MNYYFRGFVAALFVLLSGCAPEPPRPAVVSYLDVDQKQAYIERSMSALMVFREAAIDLRNRHKPGARKELSAEVERYVETQVKPIVRDFEANNNPHTRLGVAELQLLTALVYLELQEYDAVRTVLKGMEKRYGNRPEVLSASITSGHIGFRNIEDGMRAIDKRLYRELYAFPRPSSL